MKSTIESLCTCYERSQAHVSEDRNRRQALGELDRVVDKLKVGDAVNF